MVSTILLGLTLIPACSDAQKRAWKPQSASVNYRNALEAANGDDRRDAVCRIAEAGYVTSDDAFGVLDAVARTDPVSQIRCIAIRAFTRYKDERPVGTLVAILQATPESKEKALPPDDDVRWEATSALITLDHNGYVKGPQREAARDIFIKLADRGSPRTVRVAALTALDDFRHREVLPPLLLALHEEDFALADAAERSLIGLTGTTHNYDPDAWEKWLADTKDPFAHAGRKPVDTRPTPSWWQRESKRWRNSIKWGKHD